MRWEGESIPEEGSGVWGKGEGSGESQGSWAEHRVPRIWRAPGQKEVRKARGSRKRAEHAREGHGVPGRGLGFGVGARPPPHKRWGLGLGQGNGPGEERRI